MIYMKVKRKKVTKAVNHESEVEAPLGVGKYISSKGRSSLGNGVDCGMIPRMEIRLMVELVLRLM